MNRRRKQSIWLRRNLPLLIAVAALVLLVLDVFILSRRNPRLRRFNIFREHRTEEQ